MHGKSSFTDLRGQTLLEVIIAIAVIIAGVLGTISVIVASVRAGRVASDRLTALNLAREGMEIVRNIRDSNWLTPTSAWDAGLTAVNLSNGKVAIPYIHDSDPVVPVSVFFTQNLDGWDKTYPSGRRYSQVYNFNGKFTQGYSALPASGGTQFSRLIFFTPICWSNAGAESIGAPLDNTSGNDCLVAPYINEVGLQVRVEVRWPSTSVTAHKVILEDRLYNWR